jgi:hypothetical protein
MEEIAQCINNNITIVAHLQEEAKKVYSTRIFGSSISVQQIRRYPQGEILKPREMAQERVELSKAVIS